MDSGLRIRDVCFVMLRVAICDGLWCCVVEIVLLFYENVLLGISSWFCMFGLQVDCAVLCLFVLLCIFVPSLLSFFWLFVQVHL